MLPFDREVNYMENENNRNQGYVQPDYSKKNNDNMWDDGQNRYNDNRWDDGQNRYGGNQADNRQSTNQDNPWGDQWNNSYYNEPDRNVQPDTDNTAFIFSLIGILLTCGCGIVGLVFSILGLVKASEFKKANEAAGNPWPTSKATTAKTLGIISIVLFVLRIVLSVVYAVIVMASGFEEMGVIETTRATIAPGIEMITTIVSMMM